MIKGLDVFRNHFSDYIDCFVLIGGVASDLVLSAAGLDFRATKDLDIVLCLEVIDKSFAQAFWEFVKAGEYQNQQASTGNKIFYRFNHPNNKNYPDMLELFSRSPDLLEIDSTSRLTPIPVEDDLSSFSAILLDEDYYQFIHDQKVHIEGVPIVTEKCLIPLKAKAFLDLSERREAGEKIDARKVNKHRGDIFRLFQLMSPESSFKLADSIASDMKQYLTSLAQTPDLNLKTYGLAGLKVADVIDTLRKIYNLA